MLPSPQPLRRRAIRIAGVVQGVGLRPAVVRLAREMGLSGFVLNETASVRIEVEGPADRVEAFEERLRPSLPVRARVASVEARDAPLRGDASFQLHVGEHALPAEGDSSLDAIPPDLAPCAACLEEMDDPANRRYRHPFISCVHCGPRYTIVAATPYDRHRTSMAALPLCAACLDECSDPGDRRFLSQADSCPSCGPRLSLRRRGAAPSFDAAAIAAAVDLLRAGGVLAVKGAGGFALACDAANDAAVALLRARKGRPHKPFAVMGRSLEEVEAIVSLGDREREALLSPARPIVLARRRRRARLSRHVAPFLVEVGVFLPPTPLQRLLLQDGPPLQVMTSGNLSGEPLAKDDDEAQERLARVADAFLVHDRAIVARADDSVVREIGGGITTLRRARGFVPAGIPLPFEAPAAVLAVGAGEKNTVCLAAGGRAFLSPHLGELDDPRAYAAFQEAIRHLQRLHGCAATAVAHDLHPDFRSTRWAAESGLPAIAVQHHHAHVAACMVEHGRIDPVIGVAFDGTGLGEDGAVRGGEFLVADLRSFRRVGQLRPLALPGGEAAIREPWRLGLAALHDAGCPLPRGELDPRKVRAVLRLLEGRPLRATGAGRWFDAVAAICGVRAEISYEGQAALELEAAARGASTWPPFDFEVREGGGGFEIDLRPAIRGIDAVLRRFGPRTPRHWGAVQSVAARFHGTLAEAIRAGCRRARNEGAPGTVALAGGCFQNALLVHEARRRLEADGFEVLLNRRVPPNDGGIALGQAAIAAARTTPATGS
ncbi:MAG TPA: carbamoyltransferase HypF [Vulgatibacter sp.]|nr:carbamoyltransferase HypF [Vulgatibacter sp.]